MIATIYARKSTEQTGVSEEETQTSQFAGRLLATTLIVLLLSLSGCMNISAGLQPINESVKAERTNRDCKGIFFGLGFGSLSVERAMMQETRVSAGRADRPEMTRLVLTPMTKIRSIELQDWSFLFFGERCIVVTGE